MLWKFLSIAICFNDRFWYNRSIQYWPNNRLMEVSIDTYCRRQQASKSANRYLSQATVGLLLEKDPIDCLLIWNLLSRVFWVCRGLTFCTHSNVYSIKQRLVVQRQHGWSSCLLLYERFFRHQLWTLSDFGLVLRRRLRRVWTLWSSHHSRI